MHRWNFLASQLDISRQSKVNQITWFFVDALQLLCRDCIMWASGCTDYQVRLCYILHSFFIGNGDCSKWNNTAAIVMCSKCNIYRAISFHQLLCCKLSHVSISNYQTNLVGQRKSLLFDCLNGFFCKRKRNFCICNMCQCVLSSRNSCPEKRV